jgi:uncharacterized protein YciI
MKYYIIHITYVVPLETVVERTPEHREHLKSYYDKGVMLFSGPRVPRTGGILFAKAEELSTIEEMVNTDPFKTTGTANYEIIEMNPVMWAEELNNLFGTP